MEGAALCHPSVWSILDFSVSQLQQVALFFTGWCTHNECNTSLIFHLIHTSMIIFVCLINIRTIWEVLMIDTSLVWILNAFWRCIHFQNISMKILAPCWYDYLPLFIFHTIFFTMKVYLKFIIALKRIWNIEWRDFELIKTQAFCKLQAFIFHKDAPYSTLVLWIFMCT